ncbi:MAG: rhodanese-like domain-containing protein [Vulcanimicrobiaceae bacterium]
MVHAISEKQTLSELLREARANVPEISVAQARLALDRDDRRVILDVREPQEWADGHIAGALHRPRGLIEFLADPTSGRADRRLLASRLGRVFVYSGAGERSLLAAQTLRSLGYDNVASIAGGLREWRARGFPVERADHEDLDVLATGWG